jgi:hypothetical protein
MHARLQLAHILSMFMLVTVGGILVDQELSTDLLKVGPPT